MQMDNTVGHPSLEYISDLLGARVSSVKLIEGGRNSRTFKVIGENGSNYVLKQYLDSTLEGVSRLATEFSSLEFLQNKAVSCVPRPVAADHDCQCALYELVEGNKVDASRATAGDIDQMSKFLLRLKELKDDPDAVRLPNAAEACFSIKAIIRNLEGRLEKLQTIEDSSPEFDALREFLDNRYVTVLQRTVAWCHNRITNAEGSMDSELDLADRTLSPSDFGFHNCLQKSSGELVFLDFEYFGWDDPAKMTCDFLLHPAMNLSRSLKQRFVDKILGVPHRDRDLLERTANAYPLFGLKWCLILLNPFLSTYRLNRSLPGGGSPVGDSLLRQQLGKSELMLRSVEDGCMNFPYRGGPYGLRVN